ncbi:hypothetical protein AB0K43_00555 [Kitasatospora sp. NPDC049258]|uniref:hypothetical protein n=1 Tax=Kitasatospora sp. NPDC049258 TaxID=3155394 RepID=UPI003421560D
MQAWNAIPPCPGRPEPGALPLAAALLALLTACSSGTASPDGSTQASSAPIGSLSVRGSRAHLELTDAVLHRDPASGAAELTLTVRNEGSVPEHLNLISTTEYGRATLQGSKGPENALSTAGILINPGEHATFGGDGPRILFPAGANTASPTTPGTAVDTIVIFNVAGLVHLQAATG